MKIDMSEKRKNCLAHFESKLSFGAIAQQFQDIAAGP
jgi:hypothetical protein